MRDSIIINMEYADMDIVTNKKGCHRHHCIFGKNHKLADEDGLWVPLEPNAHNGSKCSAHFCHYVQRLLQIIAQLAWEKKKVAEGFSEDDAREEFRKRYGESYL